eukprot:6195614-Pleurochrysis_carterae.AAC.2
MGAQDHLGLSSSKEEFYYYYYYYYYYCTNLKLRHEKSRLVLDTILDRARSPSRMKPIIDGSTVVYDPVKYATFACRRVV